MNTLNFKLIFIIISLFLIEKAAAVPATDILPGKYSFFIYVLDESERYPVEININIGDARAKLNGMVSYPSYECKSEISFTKLSKKSLLINEKVVVGVDICEPAQLLIELTKVKAFSLNNAADYKVSVIEDGEKIPSEIKTISYKPTELSEFKIKYQVNSWDDFKLQKSPQIYKDFIKVTSKKHLKAKAEERLVEVLIELDSWDEYMYFLREAPDSIYKSIVLEAAVENAGVKLDERKLTVLAREYAGTSSYNQIMNYLFKLALKKNTFDGYVRFIDLTTLSIYSNKAKEELEKVIIDSEDKSLYYSFLDKYPNSPNSSSVALGLINLLKQESSLELFDEYLKKVKPAHYFSRVMELREPLLFEKVTFENNISGFIRYIREYPKGKYTNIIGEKIDDISYEEAKKIDTVFSYENFLTSSLTDKYRKDALESLGMKREIILEKRSKIINKLNNSLESTVSFFYTRKVFTDDCVQLYGLKQCMWVTYRYRVKGIVVRVDIDELTAHVEIEGVDLEQPSFSSLKYMEYLDEAREWLDDAIGEELIINHDSINTN